MRNIFDFVKTTVFGGIVFLVPVVILFVIVDKAFEFMQAVAEPLAPLLPFDGAEEVVLVNIVAGILVAAICFIAGLMARSRLASRLVGRLDDLLLTHVPFYAVIKSLTASVPGAEQFDGMRAVLLEWAGHDMVAFEIERIDDGNVVVFLPGAPNPWSGNVRIVPAADVRPLDTSVMAMTNSLSHMGRGMAALARTP